MAAIDAAIVLGSLVGVVALGAWLASRQRVAGDYYLGGRKLPAWALGVSLAANQASAISLIGAPAFVALRSGGGLRWLQYELAVPLAMAVLVTWGVPLLRRAPGANVYAAVEGHLGPGARRLLAGLFLIGRGGGSGVILYASALVVAAVTGWSLATSLIVVGGVAVAYTTLGGLVADVLTDVAQFVLLWGGTATVSVVLALRLGQEHALFGGVEQARLMPLDFAHSGFGDGAIFAFWPMLLGGLFLYVAYYGCDQTQAQRILAARSADDAKKALTIAAFARFPLVCTYCLLGVLLAELLRAEPQFAARLAGRPPDALVPEFLLFALPVGARGVAVAGILAAALSSIDSALNSLSAVTLEEFAAMGGRARLVGARLATAVWGCATVAAGFAFSRAGETTIELVNRFGSALYGPTLAVFVLALLSRRASGPSATVGAVAGVAGNLAVAFWLPSVSWLWWNVVGFGVAFLIGVSVRRPGGGDRPVAREPGGGRRFAVALCSWFAVILATLIVVAVVV